MNEILINFLAHFEFIFSFTNGVCVIIYHLNNRLKLSREWMSECEEKQICNTKRNFVFTFFVCCKFKFITPVTMTTTTNLFFLEKNIVARIFCMNLARIIFLIDIVQRQREQQNFDWIDLTELDEFSLSLSA